MNVNVNVNQSPDTPNQSAMLSCWKFRRLSQLDRLYTTGIKSIPLYLHLFPRKKEERKEIPNVCRHDHPVLYLIQLRISILFWIELSSSDRWQVNNSQCLELAVSHRSYRYWCEYSILPARYRPNFNIWVAELTVTELSQCALVLQTIQPAQPGMWMFGVLTPSDR